MKKMLNNKRVPFLYSIKLRPLKTHFKKAIKFIIFNQIDPNQKLKVICKQS